LTPGDAIVLTSLFRPMGAAQLLAALTVAERQVQRFNCTLHASYRQVFCFNDEHTAPLPAEMSEQYNAAVAETGCAVGPLRGAERGQADS